LRLKEGYDLHLVKVKEDGGILLQLVKDGSSVDSKVIYPSKGSATLEDQTYCYVDQTGIAILAVHFKEITFLPDGKDFAFIDGVFQISTNPLSVKIGEIYGNLRIVSVVRILNGWIIRMDNKGHNIKIYPGININIVKDIYLRTSRERVPLAYYIYKKIVIQDDIW